MGIFSSKKKTMVSSVLYNIAGDEEDRVNFIQATVLSCAITGDSIGDQLTSGIMYGQGAKLRSAHLYAQGNYTNGMPTTNFTGINVGDEAALTAAIQSVNGGQDIVLLTSKIGPADFTYWAEEYLAQQYGYDRTRGNFDYPPPGVGLSPAVTYDINSGIIRIELAGPNYTHTESFTAKNWDSNGIYAHAAYRTTRSYLEGDNQVSRPKEPSDVPFTDLVESAVTVADETFARSMLITGSIVGENFVTRTLITVVVTSRSRYFIYKLGTGTYPDLDALLDKSAKTTPYFPAIPLRQDNKDQFRDALKYTMPYKTGKRLMKRLGVETDKLVKQINDNQNIKDIDYAFLVTGVALGAQTKAGMGYLYAFFEYMMNEQKFDETQFNQWNNLPPAFKKKTSPATNTLEYFNGLQRQHNYNIKVQWQYIKKTIRNGTVKPNAKVHDMTSTMGSKQWYDMEQANGFGDTVVDSSIMVMRKQINETQFEEMQISGLVYSNEVYGGKSVIVTGYEAFNMPDDDGEGFLVPMNMDVFRAMRPLDRTQLAYECNYLVFNCYKVVKKRWYQRGAFKIVLMIVAIVITYFTAGAGSYTMAIASAIGSVIAVSATVALIIASVVTVMAGIVLGSLLSKGAVALFGEKWGRVIAAIATIVLTRQAAGANAGGAAAASTNISAQTVLQALQAVQQVHAAYTQGALIEMQDELSKMREQYQKEFDKVNDLLKELNRGSELFNLDDYMIASNQQINESVDDFLARTLMVGSEVATMTQAMVDNFASIGLSLETDA